MSAIFRRNISSFDPAECSPLADWTKLCMRDVEAIGECAICNPLRMQTLNVYVLVGIIFFMWYVIWGVPMTIRFFRWCRIQVNSIRNENLAKDIEKGYSVPPQSESSPGPAGTRAYRFRGMLHLTSKSEPCVPPSQRRLPSSSILPRIPREKQDREDYERIYSSLNSFRFPSPDPMSPTPERVFRALRARSCILPCQGTPPPSGTPLPAVPLSHSAPQFPPSYPAAVSTETLDWLFSQPARPDSLTIPPGLFRASIDMSGENYSTPPPAYAHFPNGTATGNNWPNHQEAREKP